MAIVIAVYQQCHPVREIPATWDLQEVLSAAIQPGETNLDGDVLVWHIKRDGRPLLVQSCIVWVHIGDRNGSKLFRVAHVHRLGNAPNG